MRKFSSSDSVNHDSPQVRDRGHLGSGTPGSRLKNLWAGSEVAETESMSLRTFVRHIATNGTIDVPVTPQIMNDVRQWASSKKMKLNG